MIESVETLAPADVTAVLLLVDEAAEGDGVGPLSEQVLLRLPSAAPEVSHVLDRDPSGAVTGYAQIDTSSAVAELVVAPTHRRHGVGRALLRRSQQDVPAGLSVWAHGDLQAAAALAAAESFAPSRVLLQMRRSLSEPLPEPRWPAGVRVRTFTPGSDEAAWLDVNNSAFFGHAEQGRWTVRDIEQREAQPWFDPGGFFLAESEGKLIGFHWTKVHPAEGETAPVGEVYVVGVRPQDSGKGLGPALTLIGLHHLRDQHLQQVLLYVDESNEPALKTYERLGFVRWATDVLYTRG